MSVRLSCAVWVWVALLIVEQACCKPVLIPRKKRLEGSSQPEKDVITLEKLHHECSGQQWLLCDDITSQFLFDKSTSSLNYRFESCAANARGETFPPPSPPAPDVTDEVEFEVTRPTSATVTTTEEPQRCSSQNKAESREFYCDRLGLIYYLMLNTYQPALDELKNCNIKTIQPSDSTEYKTPVQIVFGIAKWLKKMVDRHSNCCGNDTFPISLPSTVHRSCPSELNAEEIKDDWDGALSDVARLMKAVEALDSLGRENRQRCLRGCVFLGELVCVNKYYNFDHPMIRLIDLLRKLD